MSEAEKLCGPSALFDARYAELSGSSGRSIAGERGLVPNSAWEHYELGRINLRAGRATQAAENFERSLELRPQDYWPNFYHGLCSFRLRRFEAAVADFRACLVIEPQSGVAHYNRALAFEAMGRVEDAYRGYSRAIELSPRLAAARLNRGILLYRLGRYDTAIADYREGLDAEPGEPLEGQLYFNLALAQIGMHDRDSAREHAARAVALGCREAVGLFDELR